MYTPSADMFSYLRWIPIHDYFIYRKLILTFKVLHNMTPDYLNVFKFVHQVSTRTTKQSASNLLFIPRARTEYYKRSFTVSAAFMWNNLPEFIRKCRNLSSFKTAYLENYFSAR